MVSVKVDFDCVTGKIKPMNAVNNGPAGGKVRKTGNFEAYAAARFPYARLHDASFYSGYGGEFSVDVHRIFRDFEADVNDEHAYLFEPTDEYLKNITAAGTEVFYRLGASIEHGYKYGTYPPKDYLKWAQICEHIIRHYNEGWANGYRMGIEYWEIWNEPDCLNADGTNPCWQGTREEFIDFYCVTSTYLKSKFPHLKIGGPAVCWLGSNLMTDFLPVVKERGAALDFFSFHKYAKNVEDVVRDVRIVRDYLDELGFTETETCLNEWNYIKGWMAEDWEYSLISEKGLKGASFALGVMCAAQASPLDMLMYYDARPCNMNGLFETTLLKPLKTYYVYQAFADLRDLGGCAQCEVGGEGVYAVAATDDARSAILMTAYNDKEDAPDREICINVQKKNGADGVRVEVYLLNDEKNMELVREEFFTSENFKFFVRLKNYESCLIKLA